MKTNSRSRISMVAAFAVLGMSIPQVASAQDIQWTRQFGTSAHDQADAISVHASGVYVAGATAATLPGQSSAGGFDAFVRKYDAAGNEVWTRQFGTGFQDLAIAISVDASGVYVAGDTNGTLTGQTSAGGRDAFVSKYDPDGNEMWTRQFGTSGLELGLAISVDASGVYVMGTTTDTLPGQINAGGRDAFVRKYATDGNEVWTRQFGTSGDDVALAISVDAFGVYVAGGTAGTLPGQTSAGGFDAFLRKYDAAGNEVWTRQFGTSAADQANAISVDASGVYMAGVTAGTLPGQSSGDYDWDAFVRKYSADGNEVWTRQFGTSGDDLAFAISVDASGVYVAGNPGRTFSVFWDGFVRKYSTSGTELWTREFGSSGNDEAWAVSVDESGVYVAGVTDGAMSGQTNAGLTDAFVVSLTRGTPTELIQDIVDQVVSLNLKTGISNSLDSKLNAALAALDDLNQNNDAAAINSLRAFISAVEAQRGRSISDADADALIAAAQRIIASIGG